MRLMDMLLFPSLPPEIFSRLMLTVGDMVRGNEIIQQFMGSFKYFYGFLVFQCVLFCGLVRQHFLADKCNLFVLL